MKNALVTGASKRLGRAITEHLARAGYDVCIHYHSSKSQAEHLATSLVENGFRAKLLQADLIDDNATQCLVSQAAAELGGPITCLVNNASIFEPDTLTTADAESWNRHFQTNLRAPFILLQQLAAQGVPPRIDENGEPVAEVLAINMIDQRVLKPSPDFMTYTLAKSALLTLTKTAAQSLAPAIRVNAIGPGPTLKGERQTTDEFRLQRQATVLHRGTNFCDINAALDFFLHAPAATGQMLCVDGGQHLTWKTTDVLCDR